VFFPQSRSELGHVLGRVRTDPLEDVHEIIIGIHTLESARAQEAQPDGAQSVSNEISISAQARDRRAPASTASCIHATYCCRSGTEVNSPRCRSPRGRSIFFARSTAQRSLIAESRSMDDFDFPVTLKTAARRRFRGDVSDATSFCVGVRPTRQGLAHGCGREGEPGQPRPSHAKAF